MTRDTKDKDLGGNMENGTAAACEGARRELLTKGEQLNKGVIEGNGENCAREREYKGVIEGSEEEYNSVTVGVEKRTAHEKSSTRERLRRVGR